MKLFPWMRESDSYFVYIHGFNSSPASPKAIQFTEYCETHKLGQVYAPALSGDPMLAMAELEDFVAAHKSAIRLLAGSSLGGYYATWLANQYNLPAALINPAVAPGLHFADELAGTHKNYYTNAEYTLTKVHAEFLRTLECSVIRHPEKVLLLIQTGDEVLDYHLALSLYKECKQLVQKGGSHSFDNFTAVLPDIFAFAEAIEVASD